MVERDETGATRLGTMSDRIDLAHGDDHLLDDAVEYFSRSFPNAAREGCPHPNRLRELASSGDPVTGAVRTHLFQCSECFTEFRRERLALSSSMETVTPSIRQRTLRAHVPTMAVAASVVLAAGVGLILWIGAERTTRHQELSSSGTIQASDPGRSPGSAPNPASNRPVPELPGVVTIRLQASDVQRGVGADGTESPATVIRPGPVRFEIDLAAGYPDGAYQVAIVDAFDEVLVGVSARAVDRRLVASIDATGLGTGRRFLRISPANQPPDYLPIVVEAPSGR
jgi:hypothetical protein